MHIFISVVIRNDPVNGRGEWTSSSSLAEVFGFFAVAGVEECLDAGLGRARWCAAMLSGIHDAGGIERAELQRGEDSLPGHGAPAAGLEAFHVQT